MPTRRLALLTVALVIALLPATATAAAGYSTKIVVSLRFPAFHGKLASAKRACAKRRKVKLFRKRPGRDQLLGADRSNAKAKWSIPIGKRLKSGAAYYVKAPARGRCKRAKSKVLKIG